MKFEVKMQKVKKKKATEKEIKEDEFSVFLGSFLDWKKKFSIDSKDVVNVTGHSGAASDV